MKVICIILYCLLLIFTYTKSYAQNSDSLRGSDTTFKGNDRSIYVNPFPGVNSFEEKVRLWEYFFMEAENLRSGTSLFMDNVREDIRKSIDREMNIQSNWNWKQTNYKKRPRFSKSKIENDNYRDIIFERFRPKAVEPISSIIPVSRQIVNFDLFEIPQLYMLFKLLTFLKVLDSFLREAPTKLWLKPGLSMTYRKERLVFTLTF
ncbi:MAG: hypothetical protein ACRCX5_13600 [Bacteroidales bacterium]